MTDDTRNTTHDRMRRDIRALKAYAAISTLAFGIISLAAFRQGDQKQHFGEIDVERLNLVERDGTPRMIMSNKARFPGLILHRKEYPHPRNQAGILFFNNEGTENGGLATGVSHENGKYSASSQIMFDQYEADQTVGLNYTDDNGRRSAGLYVWDRANTPIQDVVEKMQVIRAMPDGPEKTRAMAELRKTIPSTQRVVVGKTMDRSAAVILADTAGRPRLRMVVDVTGAPRLDFLGADGTVTYSLPDSAHHGR